MRNVYIKKIATTYWDVKLYDFLYFSKCTKNDFWCTFKNNVRN